MITKVSIIIPVYNCEDYIEECIISIIKQSYDNLEIIIVNDGSTDDTKHIIELMKNKYGNRIQLISLESSFGVSNARNIGLSNSDGEIVMFVDADDMLSDINTVLNIVTAMERESANLATFITEEFDDNDSFTMTRTDCIDYSVVYNSTEIIRYVTKLTVWSFAYRRTLIYNKHFNTKYHLCEDVLFLSEVIPNVESIVDISFVGYKRRIHGGSLIHSSITEQEIKDTMELCNLLSSVLKDDDVCQYVLLNTETVLIHKIGYLSDNKAFIKLIKPKVYHDSVKMGKNPLIAKRKRILIRLFLINPKLYFLLNSINSKLTCPRFMYHWQL